MKRIVNIFDLVTYLEPYQIIELNKDLKICEGKTIDFEKIVQIILDTCQKDINNLGSTYENHVCSYYSLYEIEFSEEFQDEVYYKNQNWMDKLFFLFQLYGYDYLLCCLREGLFLEPPYSIDFFKRLDVYIEPYSGEFLDERFYCRHEKKIVALYQKERRSDKVQKMIDRITT